MNIKVYNWKCKQFRDIVLIPTKNWSGEGMLGVTIKFDTYYNAEEHLCHVLEIEQNSPAELSGIETDVDYLLGTTERAFIDVDILHEELEASVNRPMEVYVYNSLLDEVRTVVILPNIDWGGNGLLGANVAQGYLHVLPSKCSLTIGK